MKDLTFYDQVGILFPGSVLLIGILVLFPEFKNEFTTGGVSVGGLGLFLIVAYVLGHLVAALAGVLEKIVWAPDGGMPSSWLARKKPPLLKLSAWLGRKKQNWTFLWPNAEKLVQDKLYNRLKITVVIADLDQNAMQKYFWPIYQDALTHETGNNRITTFNGIYGLSRGVAVALLVLAAALPILPRICPARHLAHWPYWSAALAVVAVIFIHRMREFGESYAKEVYRVFVQLPDDPSPSAGAKKTAG